MAYVLLIFIEGVYYTHDINDKPNMENVINLPSPGQRGLDEIIASRDPLVFPQGHVNQSHIDKVAILMLWMEALHQIMVRGRRIDRPLPENIDGLVY